VVENGEVVEDCVEEGECALGRIPRCYYVLCSKGSVGVGRQASRRETTGAVGWFYNKRHRRRFLSRAVRLLPFATLSATSRCLRAGARTCARCLARQGPRFQGGPVLSTLDGHRAVGDGGSVRRPITAPGRGPVFTALGRLPRLPIQLLRCLSCSTTPRARRLAEEAHLYADAQQRAQFDDV
jgi:hypothetical protein